MFFLVFRPRCKTATKKTDNAIITNHLNNGGFIPLIKIWRMQLIFSHFSSQAIG